MPVPEVTAAKIIRMQAETIYQLRLAVMDMDKACQRAIDAAKEAGHEAKFAKAMHDECMRALVRLKKQADKLDDLKRDKPKEQAILACFDDRPR